MPFASLLQRRSWANGIEQIVRNHSVKCNMPHVHSKAGGVVPERLSVEHQFFNRRILQQWGQRAVHLRRLQDGVKQRFPRRYYIRLLGRKGK